MSMTGKANRKLDSQAMLLPFSDSNNDLIRVRSAK
jgi:hypothetical protein